MSLNLADPPFLGSGLLLRVGSAKNYGSCPLDKILSSGYLANHCLCFWTTNFIHWLAAHWISSCPVDNFIQWITLSSILNNRALAVKSTTLFLCWYVFLIYFVMIRLFIIYLSYLNIVNTLESTSFNGFWPNLVHT